MASGFHAAYAALERVFSMTHDVTEAPAKSSGVQKGISEVDLEKSVEI